MKVDKTVTPYRLAWQAVAVYAVIVGVGVLGWYEIIRAIRWLAR